MAIPFQDVECTHLLRHLHHSRRLDQVSLSDLSSRLHFFAGKTFREFGSEPEPVFVIVPGTEREVGSYSLQESGWLLGGKDKV